MSRVGLRSVFTITWWVVAVQLATVGAVWWSEGATVTARVDPALSGYNPVAVNLIAHPQFTYTGNSITNLLGQGETVYGVKNLGTGLKSPQAIVGTGVWNGSQLFSQTIPSPQGTMQSLTMTPYGFALCAGNVYIALWNGTFTQLLNTTCAYAPMVSYDGSRVYYANVNFHNEFFALDSQTGATIWSKVLPALIFGAPSMPQDANGFLYILPWYEGLDSENVSIYAAKIDGATGDVVALSDLNGLATAQVQIGFLNGPPPMMVDTGSLMLYVTANGRLQVYSLDFASLWNATNPQYNPTATGGSGACLALNAAASASVVYWSSQTWLFAVATGNGSTLWSLNFPYGINTFTVTGEGNINVALSSGALYVISPAGEMYWGMSLGNLAGYQVMPVAINAALLVFNLGYGAFAGLGFASIVASSNPVMAVGGQSNFNLYLDAYPTLGQLQDTSLLSISCLTYSADNTLTGVYNGMAWSVFVAEPYLACNYNYTAQPAAATTTLPASVAVTMSYADGSVYATRRRAQAFVAIYGINPTSGPLKGGTTVTITGAGFSNCKSPTNCALISAPGTLSEQAHYPITFIDDTTATWVAPAAPCGSFVCGVGLQLSVAAKNNATTVSQMITFTWLNAGVVDSWVWGLVGGLAAAFLLAIVCFIIYHYKLYEKCGKGGKDQTPLLDMKGKA